MEELERLRSELAAARAELLAARERERLQQLTLEDGHDTWQSMASNLGNAMHAEVLAHKDTRSERDELRLRVDEMALTQEKLQTKLAEAERAARLNLELLRDARRERDEAQARLRKLAAAPSPVDLQRQLIAALAKVPFHWAASWQRPASGAESHVELHSGAHLFWATNAAGGRTYWSDEVGGGVNVWDTALVSYSTLCEAIAVEFGLLAAERREEQKVGYRTRASEHPADDGPDVSKFIAAGMAAQAAVDALTTPCPTCGALGCPVPCPNAEPV